MPSTNPLRQAVSKLRQAKARHELRHQPSGFDFALADSITFLNGRHWDLVTGGRRFFLRRPVLEAVEANLPSNVAPRYALLFRDGKPLAAVAAQMVDLSGEKIWDAKAEAPKPAAGKREALKRALLPAAHKVIGGLEERALVAGNLMSWGFHGVAFAEGADPAELWSGVAEALYRIRRAENLSGKADFIMVKDMTPAEAHAEALRTFSYRPLETDPDMVLTLDPGWKTYEDYLAALSAKPRRNIRDQLKKMSAAGCVMENLTDLPAHASALHRLYLAVQEKATVKPVSVPEGYLPALARAAPEDFRCTVVRRNGEILGFVTSLREGDTCIAYHIGFDRAAAAEGIPLYLRLLHATVADAIGWGCRRLSLGRTALEPKANLGAKPDPMTVWLRHRIPAVNWMIRGLLGHVPHGEAPNRNPFRES